VPLYRFAKLSARGLPVCFQEAPALKKPRRKASRQEWAAWPMPISATREVWEGKVLESSVGKAAV
jgi:hypothetical protein